MGDWNANKTNGRWVRKRKKINFYFVQKLKLRFSVLTACLYDVNRFFQDTIMLPKLKFLQQTQQFLLLHTSNSTKPFKNVIFKVQMEPNLSDLVANNVITIEVIYIQCFSHSWLSFHHTANNVMPKSCNLSQGCKPR